MQKPTCVADLLSTRPLRLSNSLALYRSRRYRRKFEATLSEWRVISIIAGNDRTTGDISRVLATDKAWVGITAKALIKRGFLAGSRDAKVERPRPGGSAGTSRHRRMLRS